MTTALMVIAFLLVVVATAVAVVRRRLRRAAPATVSNPSVGLVRASGADPGSISARSTANVITVQDGDTELMEITRCDSALVPAPMTPALSSEASSALQTVLRFVPTVAGSSYLQDGTFVVRFSPAALAGLKDGTLELMESRTGARRAVAVYADGKQIFENATVRPLAALPIVTAAVWQGMAVLTAQQFLTEIDAKLERIEAAVTELRRLADTKQLGTLQGNLAYLLQLKPVLPDAIRAGRSGAYESELESMHRELLGEMASLRLQLDGVLQRLRPDAAQSSLSSFREGSDVRDLLAEFMRLHRTLAFAVLLGAMTAELRLVISGLAAESEERLRLLEAEMESQQQRLHRLNRIALRRIKQASGRRWLLPLRTEDSEGSARRTLREISAMNHRLRPEIENALQSVRMRVLERSMPGGMELLVETVEDGRIASVHVLSHGSAVAAGPVPSRASVTPPR
jgi:hypothetical protein